MNPRRTRTAALTALLSAGAVLLTSCGQGIADEASRPTSPSTTTISAAAANSADVQFAQMMIVHHQGALDIAALAADRANSQDVQDLAARIQAAQQPEIRTMTGWLTSWGQEPLDAGGSMPGMTHGAMSTGGVGGVASEDDMSRLREATGNEFDQLFLTLMIAHHEGAIAMAQSEVDNGQNPDAVALATKVVADQSTEIEEMKTLLAAYGGN